MKYDLTIKIPEQLNSITFESILKKYYRISKLKKNDHIEFDLQQLIWCDIFELSLFGLWLKELKNFKKDIAIKIPVDKKIIRFFKTYEFFTFIKENNISIDNENYYSEIKDFSDKPYYPLKIYDQIEYDNLKNDLAKEDKYSLVFQDIFNSGIINSSALRNIVLKELGDNIFQHAGGKLPLILMSKFKINELDKIKRIDWQEKLVKNSNPLEHDFLLNLEGRSYFTIVVSDKGEGIVNKLMQSYINDKIIKNKKDNPNGCDILEYAFLEHSTSRTIDERLGLCADLYRDYEKKYFEGKPPKTPPATGLYQLINTVKEYFGFLYVRCNDSAISYDFYSNPTEPRIHRNDKTKSLRKMTFFEGTQIKIHFPLNISYNKYKLNEVNFNYSETKRDIKYSYLNLYDYFKDCSDENSSNINKKIFELFEFLKKHKYENSKYSSGIIFDMYNISEVSHKIIHFIVAKIAKTQNDNYAHVIINASTILYEQLYKTFNPKKEKDTKSILCFSVNFQRQLIGIEEDEQKVFEGIISTETILNSQEKEFVYKHSHLFDNKYSDRPDFIHNRDKIFNSALFQIQDILNKNILNANNNFFYPEVKVKLLSKVYCLGYFELYNILDGNEIYFLLLKEWLIFLLFITKPNVLISVSKLCNKIANDVINEYKARNIALKVQHKEIVSPLSVAFSDLFSLSSEISENDNVLIFTDVIGSKKTIVRIINSITQTKSIRLSPIIDATSENQDDFKVNNVQIQLLSLIKNPLKFFHTKPAEWSYDNILTVDPTTNKLNKNIVNIQGPVWCQDYSEKGFSDDFVKRIILPHKSILNSHFISRNKHITYLFDIPSIVLKHSSEIIDSIYNDFKNLQNIDTELESRKVFSIIYPSFNPGLFDLTLELSKKLFCKPQPVASSDLMEQNVTFSDEYNEKLVFIIDDALDSGDNIFSLIDYCARKKAEYIFIYVLICRGSRKIIRRLENLKVYSESKLYFKYLASIPIPTYDKLSCPVCNIKDDLENFLEYLSDSENEGLNILRDFLKDEINRYASVPVDSVSKISNVTYYNSLNYYEEIVLRCKFELARYSDKARAEIVTYIYKNSKTEAILSLLNLMFYEDLYEIFLTQYESSETELKLIEVLVENCLYFLEEPSRLNHNDFNTLLTALRYFSEDDLLNKFFKYGRDTINKKENFLILNYNLIILESAYKYSQSIISDLEQLYSLDISDELKDFIQGLINYWNERLEENKIRVNEKIEYLKELSKIFHEIKKYTTYLLTYEEYNEIDPELRNEWNSLTDVLKRISRYLRELTTIKFEDKSKIKSLNILINKINNLILIGNQMLNSPSGSFSINEFKKIVESIKNTIDEDELSVANILSYFKVDLKGLTKRVVYTMNHSLFSDKNIKVKSTVPEDNCLVFGDTTGLNLVISNVVDNVIRHSKAQNFYYKLNIHKEKQIIELEILDDGYLDPNYKIKRGISKIKEITTNYYGNYELKPIENINYSPSLDNFNSKLS
jgi:signal transduction histidine kinase